MKRIFTFFLSLIFTLTSFAQIGGGWDWAFNTGGSGPELRHLAYKADGELVFYCTGLTALKFGATTFTAPNVLSYPGTVKVLGKISTTGEPTVLRSYSNPNFNIDCVTSDSSGNFYIAGGVISGTTADFGNGITYTASANLGYVTKLDANGNAQWIKTFAFGATGIYTMQIQRIAVSRQGNIFLQGLMQTQPHLVESTMYPFISLIIMVIRFGLKMH